MNFPEVRMRLTLLGWIKKQEDSKLKDIHTAEMWAKGNQYAYLQPGFEGSDLGAYVNYYPDAGKGSKTKFTYISGFMKRLERDDN